MPKRMDIGKVLVIGSGPIVIGQAAEFDYAGTQACKALQEEGIEVILVNSNPATIMTDDHMASRVYIQPLTVEALTYIIDKERPDGLLATLGGQTGLNLAMELDEAGVLKQFNVKLLGTPLTAIQQAEDREEFKTLMEAIGEPIAPSRIVENLNDACGFAEEIGFPIIVRPAFTLGGTGGGIAQNLRELETITQQGLMHSRIHQVLVEQSVAGWKEIEYEVMRDGNDTCIVVCNMENFDPIGIHTGDSIVVAPSQTLTDEEYHMLRSSALKIIRSLKIEGGCNVQYALHPTSLQYYVIEVNPRVSRSSALASKAAGYPIAKIAAKIALGLHLHEIPNAVTQKTKASFEPALDYIVTKIPKWPFDKFAYASRTLGTQMKATGEVMAIDRSFESSLLKAVLSLEGKEPGLRRAHLTRLDKAALLEKLSPCDDERLFVIAEALRKGATMEEIHAITQIDRWFLRKLENIIQLENHMKTEPLTPDLLRRAETMGFTDHEIQDLSKESMATIDTLRRAHQIYPVYKIVDSCAGEFEAVTPYYYSSFETEDENIISRKPKVLVIGSGPIRIGQGIEFDYCSVHAAWALQKAGFEAIIVNNNPETVSTDFDTADKLYFEPLFHECVNNIIQAEMPQGIIVQFGGQTAINLAPHLIKRGVQVLGTSVASTDVAEDRNRFERLLRELGIPQPRGTAVTNLEDAYAAAREIGFPVLVRPSYVIGGQAMEIVHNEDELREYVEGAATVSPEHPVLIDQYIEGKEVEVDAISDRRDVLIPGIMEHIERAGVHSGDSFSVYPSQTLSQSVLDKLVNYTQRLAQALRVVGLMNIQFVVDGENVYVIEVNPRASRTVPILSKVTQVPMVQLAVNAILGQRLKDQGYGVGLMTSSTLVAVKAPVFSFQKLKNVDVALAPEMKSTGEVLGVDTVYEKALLKAFLGAGFQFPETGTIFVSLNPRDRTHRTAEVLSFLRTLYEMSFDFLATEGTAAFLREHGYQPKEVEKGNMARFQELMQNRGIVMVINTPTHGKNVQRDGFQIRGLAEQYTVPCFTSLDTLQAYLRARQVLGHGTLTYDTLNEYRGSSTRETTFQASSNGRETLKPVLEKPAEPILS